MLCGMWDLSSLTRREPVPLEMEEQSLTHWTTRKALISVWNKSLHITIYISTPDF